MNETCSEKNSPLPIQRIHQIPGRNQPTLVIHAGAGGRISELSHEETASFTTGLKSAYTAGQAILAAGGSAVEAVCAAVISLEDNPLFNAGVGAALTFDGKVEHDACLVSGSGKAGAIAGSTRTKNPILLAHKIMTDSPHVFIANPGIDLAQRYQLATCENSEFVTEARKAQLKRILASEEAALKHGTVGAVAVDSSGGLASATSTGGISKQWPGRIGDTAVVGAGGYARNGVVAVSCTGDGEAFLSGCVAHDIYARMSYGGQGLAQAVTATINSEVGARNATGGLICVTPDGTVLLAHNSEMMFAAFCENGEIITWV